MENSKLEWTGERFLPGVGGTIALEHVHRYEVASHFVSNKTVLDIACGEGYGSEILSRYAQKVTGVDIAEEAVAHANAKYASPKVEYKTGSCLNIPLPDASYDVVVSFETIEHVAEHDQMMSEIKRVLRPGGTLIISSPNKEIYSDIANYQNEHHVRELYKQEFIELIRKSFSNHVLLGQRVVYGSAIISEDCNAGFRYIKNIEEGDTDRRDDIPLSNPMYWMAICADQKIEDIYSSILEQDLDKTDFALAIKSLNDEKMAYSQENSKMNKIINENQLQIAQLAQHSSELESTINLMANSLSWKITSPLRVADNILKNIFKNK